MDQGTPFGISAVPLLDFDAVCQNVRSAMEPARAHAVSLHDETGEILWLSDSSMGPDEHDAVRDALEAFSNVGAPPIDRLHAALRRSPIALHVQRLVPLTKGSQLRRHEVLLRSKSDDAPNAAPHAILKAAVENGLGSMIDRPRGGLHPVECLSPPSVALETLSTAPKPLR